MSKIDLSVRSHKALEIVLGGHVEPLPRKGAVIHSQNGGGEYKVTENFCTCPDFQYRGGNICKHVRAYRVFKALEKADCESELGDSDE